MIDYDNILTVLSTIAREPTYTPTLSVDPGSGLKNVLRAYPDDQSKPDYPYMVVDIPHVEEEGGWEVDSYVADDDFSVVHATNFTLLITFTIYGEGAKTMASTLNGYFRYGRVMDDIRVNTGGGRIKETFMVNLPNPSLATKFVEASQVNLMLSVTDSSTDEQAGVINIATVEGELFSSEEDTTPIEIDITVPTP